MADFSQTINQFSNDIYKECCDAKKDTNVILSPLSIQTAVSLALMGAKGKTAEEMTSVLRFGSIPHTEIASNFQSLMSALNKGPSVKVANKIYVHNERSVKKAFSEIATKNFFSEAESIQFSDNVGASNKINAWVESKTNNKIKDLISSDSINDDTRMVLVNAIYFKGLWQHPFKTEDTKPLPFYTNETDSVEVPMMYHKQKYFYGNFENLDATGLELKYKDSDVSMFIILPNKRSGLADLEKKLTTVNLKDLSDKMRNVDVHVTLPKFKVEFSISLKDILTKMGMSTMFSNGADFSNLLEGNEPLKVSDVVHKAFIEVNEEGAEAAAATGVMMMCRMLPIEEEFVMDHPFFYAMLGTGAKYPFFTGRICNSTFAQ